jgi:hypothetical protein
MQHGQGSIYTFINDDQPETMRILNVMIGIFLERAMVPWEN